MILHVNVSNKVATYLLRDGAIVCGNSDYQIKFTFDEEWSAHSQKTAHFIWGGKHRNVNFTGDTCAVPPIKNATELKVGVYVEGLRTTTSAVIPCVLSTLCEASTPLPDEEQEEEYASEAKASADRAEAAATRAEDAAERAEAAGGGGSGENGATFTPSVSSSGVLSWSNDKGLTNPPPVNIKGSPGVAGDAGRGISGVSLVSSKGLVDTYRITFTDNDSTTFTVKNGRGIVAFRHIQSYDTYDLYEIEYTDGATQSLNIPHASGGGGGTGEAGRGIAKIESTTGGTDENGRPFIEYTIIYTDGTRQPYVVTDGKDGADGVDGKSAYKYAQELGYTGTEDEFAEALKKAAQVGESKTVNVRDFGAIGDGVANDQPAIEAAFAYAVEHLPCEVYFPTGEYGILHGGITVNIPKGSGGLTIRGDGKNLSKIKYLEDWETAGTWYAIRIQPLGKETAPPVDTSEYLHDIVIRDIGVYDTDPLKHCWHTDKGDTDTEETHGFDIQYCVRATVRDCLVENVGDEAIDIYFCEDVIVANNNVVGSPAAGAAGGAISIGDGSKNVIVEGNTVRKTRADESETVPKRNFGIAVEAIAFPVEKVVIANNVISDINGNGINIGTPGGTITDVTISDNIISDVTNIGIMLSSTNDHINIRIVNNTVRNCGGDGIGNDGDANGSLLIENCTIIGAFRGVYNNMGEITVSKCNIRDTAGQGIFVTKKAIIAECVLTNVCNDIGRYKNNGAVEGYMNDKLDIVVRDTSIITNSVYGTMNAHTVIDVNVTTNPSYSGTAYGGTNVKYIYGGKISCRAFASFQSGGVVNGLVIDSTVNQWQPAIALADVTGVIVTGCRITYKGTSKDAIIESGTSDYNLITNNLVSRPITVIGANSVNANNIVSYSG